jgi:hypothetical protein
MQRLEGDDDVPDLDNITKPFLDSLEGKIIVEDAIFQEIHLRKVELNHEFDPEPDMVFDAKVESVLEFVYVRVEPLEWEVPTRLSRSGVRM